MPSSANHSISTTNLYPLTFFQEFLDASATTSPRFTCHTKNLYPPQDQTASPYPTIAYHLLL